MRRCAFTLIELLVAVSVIAVLIGLLLPALAQGRKAGQKAACLSNMRQLETAHWAYLTERDGRMIGTSHGTSWMDELRDNYNPKLLLRSPVDTSPHFDGGTAVSGKYRQTSYSINLYLSPDGVSHGLADAVAAVDAVPSPTATIHFGIAVFEGPAAVQDHYHPNAWANSNPALPPIYAAGELQTHAHGGNAGDADARSTYGYLDGHAEIQPFNATYVSVDQNHYNPAAAR